MQQKKIAQAFVLLVKETLKTFYNIICQQKKAI